MRFLKRTENKNPNPTKKLNFINYYEGVIIITFKNDSIHILTVAGNT